ncbi:hypothetical protein ACWGDE_07605 [Streptomyces sp. NPDC054956]
MMITPPIATLLGMTLGALATIGGQWVTQKATRSRERDHKVWERRADALEETHRVTLARQRDRQELSSTGKRSAVRDTAVQEDQARLLSTKLALYASPELLAANDASVKTYGEWVRAVWHWAIADIGDTLPTAPPTPEQAAEQAAAKAAAWEKLEQAKSVADEADKVLVKQLRADASLVPRGRWRQR